MANYTRYSVITERKLQSCLPELKVSCALSLCRAKPNRRVDRCAIHAALEQVEVHLIR
jgi:hypothetical protein